MARMWRDKTKRILLFLSGRVYRAGRSLVYDKSPERAERFLDSLIARYGDTDWKIGWTSDVRIRRKKRAWLLRAHLWGRPRGWFKQLWQLYEVKRLSADQLTEILPALCAVCHDDGGFRFEAHKVPEKVAFLICPLGDLHVYVGSPTQRKEVQKLAAACGLRCPPRGYDRRCLINRNALGLNIELGLIRKSDVGRRDLSTRPGSPTRRAKKAPGRQRTA